jgi:ABC-type glycerol-3-phosphate transport system substrate-binding protein
MSQHFRLHDGKHDRSAIRQSNVLFTILLCIVGCSHKDSPSKAAKALSNTLHSTAPLEVIVIDDPFLAAAIEREWRAVSQSAIEVKCGPAEQIPEGDTADVIVFPPCQMGDLVGRRVLRPLTGSAEPRLVDLQDFFPLSRHHEMRWGKQLYAVSLGSPQLALFFDVEAFQEQGLTPPKTWVEYQQAIDKLPSDESTARAAEPLGPGWAALMFVARAASYAREPNQYSCLFDMQTMQPRIALPPFVRALDELRSAAAKMPVDTVRMSPGDVMDLFVKRQIAMAISWPSAARAEPAEAPSGWKPGVAMLPGATEYYDSVKNEWVARGQGEAHVPVLGLAGRCVGLTRQTRNLDRALDFVTWLSAAEQGPRVTSRSTETTIFRFSQKSQVDAWVGRSLVPIERDYFEVILQNQSSPLSLTAVRIPGQHQYMQVLDEAIRSAITSRESSLAVLAGVVEKWQQITDRLGRSGQTAAYQQSLGIN